jgi:hypothetical protein
MLLYESDNMLCMYTPVQHSPTAEVSVLHAVRVMQMRAKQKCTNAEKRQVVPNAFNDK